MAAFDIAGSILAAGDFVDEIAGLKSQYDVFRLMKRLADVYRCRAFMVFNLPPVTSFDLQNNIIISNWPPELLTAYDQEGLMLNSPLLRRLRNSALPFFYDVSDINNARDDDKKKTIIALLERFRMPRCAHFPTHDAAGLRGCVSLSGDREPFTHNEMSELTYISIHVYDRLGQIRQMDTRLADALTDREIDCLTWTAAGKTSSEIANIVGLSEHTVNHYLNRATKKLDTVNRTQAVAKALRIGLIK